MNFQEILKINIKKAYLIHFRYKSTEEYIKKYKRGYSYWYGNKTNKFMKENLETYFQENGVTIEKINYIEKELKLNLSQYRCKLNSKINFLKNILINEFFFLLLLIW